MQRTAGNRAVQHIVSRAGKTGDSGTVIQRRWVPARLGAQLASFEQLIANAAAPVTRYVIQGTNPLVPGVGTYFDSAGPLTLDPEVQQMLRQQQSQPSVGAGGSAEHEGE
jgi:hypothetical protein